MDKDLISSFLKKIKPGITEEKIDQLYKEHGLENLDENTVGSDMRNLLISIDCAIASDWKWRPQDVLFELRVIVPGFQFDLKKADFNENTEKWEVEVAVGGEKISFVGGMEDLSKFVEMLNPVINRLCNMRLEEFITGGDSYFYLFVPNGVSFWFDERDLVEM
jgi:hypothetical protein